MNSTSSIQDLVALMTSAESSAPKDARLINQNGTFGVAVDAADVIAANESGASVVRAEALATATFA